MFRDQSLLRGLSLKVSIHNISFVNIFLILYVHLYMMFSEDDKHLIDIFYSYSLTEGLRSNEQPMLENSFISKAVITPALVNPT